MINKFDKDLLDITIAIHHFSKELIKLHLFFKNNKNKICCIKNIKQAGLILLFQVERQLKRFGSAYCAVAPSERLANFFGTFSEQKRTS